MKKNVLIVHYNTQELTDTAIWTLNRHTAGCDVYVFDNSDKRPFVNGFYNVKVIDNTQGQLIDFESELAKFPDKAPSENRYASAKHCMSVDYCFRLLPDGFLLMDSDVVVKDDVTPFFDTRNMFAYIGMVKNHRCRFGVTLPRVLPFLCYINVPMCHGHGISYYNPDKMFALSNRKPDMGYDTGCWFWEECYRKGLVVNQLNIFDYIDHLGHGSWKGGVF